MLRGLRVTFLFRLTGCTALRGRKVTEAEGHFWLSRLATVAAKESGVLRSLLAGLLREQAAASRAEARR